MHCVDNLGGQRASLSSRTLPWLGASAVLMALLVGCGSAPNTAPTMPAAPAPAPSLPAPAPAPKPSVKLAPKVEEYRPTQPAAVRARSIEELRLLAAKRLVAANPDITYTGKPPELLLAIPVISIELNGDGSVKSIFVLRHPSQALDTEEIAREAIMRAAPFGDVSALPKPWKFTETFLFNKERKFKPMTLDQQH